MMTWRAVTPGGRLWPEIRYRLIVLACAAAVVGSMGLALRGSVHIGDEPEPSYPQNFNGEVTRWQVGSPDLAGWVENDSDARCHVAVGWLNSRGRQTLVWIGPVAAHQRMDWGSRLGTPGHYTTLSGPPIVDLYCMAWEIPSP